VVHEVLVERIEAGRLVESARIELRQEAQEPGQGLALARGTVGDASGQVAVREAYGGLHHRTLGKERSSDTHDDLLWGARGV
jgi:hypothetical protein